jgi:hypothetical protein
LADIDDSIEEATGSRMVTAARRSSSSARDRSAGGVRCTVGRDHRGSEDAVAAGDVQRIVAYRSPSSESSAGSTRVAWRRST